MSRASQFSQPGLPLTPPVLYVLISLSLGDRHGYDILKHVRDSSRGAVRLGPGTLYTTLKRMLEAGLIAEVVVGDAVRWASAAGAASATAQATIASPMPARRLILN